MKITRLHLIILGIIILAAYFFYVYNRNQQKVIQAYQAKEYLTQDSLFELKTINGKLLAEKDVLLLDHKEAVAELSSELDSIKIKYKNLESVTKVKTVTKYGITIPDTVTTIEYKDRWIGYRATRIDNGLKLDIQTFDSLSIYTHWKKHLFKADELTISAVSHNPHNTILGLSSIKVKARQKRFSIGPHVGLDVSGKATVGISLQYSLVRF